MSVGALYFAFKNVPFSDLIAYFKSINYIWMIPSVIVVILSFVVRVLRWQVILSSSHKISFRQAFHPLMIGFMLNSILPARLGEVARPAILLKNDNVPFSVGLATVAAERIFDLIIIIILFAGVLSYVHIDPAFNYSFGDLQLNKDTLNTVAKGTVRLCIVLVIGVALVSISRTRKMISRLIMILPTLLFFLGEKGKEKFKNLICVPLVRIVENFAAGFNLVKQPKKLFLCFGLSLFVWVLAAFSYYLVSLGCPGIGLSFFDIMAVMIIICFFIALPSVPGYWGLWEAGGVFALIIFGVSKEAAGGYTLVNHAIQMFPVIIVGIVSAVMTGVNIWQIQYDGKNEIPTDSVNEKTSV